METLEQIIHERHSLRMPFDSEKPVAKRDLKQILEAGSWAPTAHNMQNFAVVVVDDKALLASLGAIKRPISEAFIRENYPLLSFSEEELARKKVGIMGTNFPPSWRNPDARPPESIGKEEFASPFPACATLLVVLYDPAWRAPASEGDFLGIISLGCVMENMWLMANSLGIGFHIISALSAERVENEVKQLLNIPDKLKIAFSARLGYPITPPPNYVRVRRDVDDFVHYNGFGCRGFD